MTEGMAPADLRLHIGAHKTATTHLQDILAANRTYLLDRDILYLPRMRVRQIRLIQAINDNYWNTKNATTQIASLETLIRPKTRYTKRIIVSEENILGGCIDLIDCLYPTANNQLLPWSAITDQDNTTIYLSIRDYTSILPSAFSQALRDGSKALPFEVYLQKWLHKKPSWHALVTKIKTLFPLTKIVVWTFEKYIQDNAEIVNRLSGINLPKVDVRIPKSTQSLTKDAVARIQGIDPDLDLPARMKLIREIMEKYESIDIFDPLSLAEKKELHDNYVADIEIVKKMDIEYLG